METTLSSRELIQLAIEREKTSYALYSCAAVMAVSSKVKGVFNRIARDELVHLLTLLRNFARLYPELIEEVNIIMPVPEEAAVEKLAAVEESAEALLCAIQEEYESLQFYIQLARVVEDQEARMALQTIIRDESNHVKALKSLEGDKIEETDVQEKAFH